MRFWSFGLVGVALAAAGQQRAAASLPPGHFGWMADLAGACWRADYPDAKTTDTQCYSTQYDRYLRGTIEIRSGAPGARTYRGDSTFVWDPETAGMRFHYWSSEGNNGVSQGMIRDGAIIFTNPPSTDAAKPARRSVWSRVSPDSYRVTLQQNESEAGWRDVRSVTYSRFVPVDDHGASVDCSQPQFRQLDYMIGEWDVVDTRTGAHFLANEVRAVNAGCAILELLTMRGDVPGSSLNFYSPTDKKWHAFYHSPTLHAVLEGAVGADGRHELQTRATLPGEKDSTLVRQITSRDSAGRPRQVGIAVDSNGKSRELWDLTFCPLRPGGNLSPPCDNSAAAVGIKTGSEAPGR